jgi:hypothetical protein
MQSRPRLGACVLTTIIAATLLGCAIVDQYSGRAIVYNLEAEQAQDQALLLNIVRASLRRPMQFTTVSSITGVASAGASAQYTLPTNVPFRPATQGATGIAAFPPLPTWLFSGSVSGGPAFTVPVLDTQEFYQGILRAIPGQLWDLYIQANYPNDLLFNLFIEKVVMRRTDGPCPEADHLAGCEFVFVNSVVTNIQIDLFQALADYMLALGLTTELSTPQHVAFDHPTNVNVRYVGAPGPGGNETEAQVVAPPGGSTPSDAQTPARPYKICFAPRTDSQNRCVFPKSVCGQRGKSPTLGRSQVKIFEPEKRTCNQTEFKINESTTSNQIQSSGSASVNVIASHEFVQRLMQIAKDDAPEDNPTQDPRHTGGLEAELSAFDMKPVNITIYMRHTEGIIYYVGQVVRRALDPDLGEQPRDIFVKTDQPYRFHPEKLCAAPSKICEYVFRLNANLAYAPDDFLSVVYDGRWYSIPRPDPLRRDLSSLTFDILKQLVALNSAAKSLPQSSVITTVGQ